MHRQSARLECDRPCDITWVYAASPLNHQSLSKQGVRAQTCSPSIK